MLFSHYVAHKFLIRFNLEHAGVVLKPYAKDYLKRLEKVQVSEIHEVSQS